VSPLDRAIYPPMESRRQPRAAAGCPVFKKDSVLRRPDDGVAMSHTVAPGSHSIAAVPEPPFEVVWWDPAALQLGAEPPFGLRRQELISKDVPLEVVAEGTARYIAWRNAREEICARAAQPSLHVRTATEWSKNPNSQLPSAKSQVSSVEVITIDAVDGRPTGPRFGALVHAALAAVALEANGQTIDQTVAVQGRIVGAPREEVVAAQQVVRAVLSHELLAAARSADERGALFRETPTTIVMDGQLLEGNVDLAFDTAEGFTVIDFKTDRAEGELQAAYRRQVGLYAEAISQATGRPAKAVLMSV